MVDSPTFREQLLAAADRWCHRTGLSRAHLASMAARDGKFFDRIAAGGDCTTGMFEKVMAVIETDLAARGARGALKDGTHG